MVKFYLIVSLAALGSLIPSAHAADYAVPVVESPAEVPVYQSQGIPPGPASTTTLPPAPATSYTTPADNFRRGNPADLLYQVETLQQEVQTLRGMVEEQGYLLQQMREEQRDRYLDLDRRISLTSQGDASTDQPAATSNTDNNPATATITSVDAGEKNAYDAAFNLIRLKKYDDAIVALKQFSQDYPDGVYTANAYYWLGEVEIVKGNFNDALAAFGLMVEKYPQHRKIPDAKYKQGKLYRRLGDKVKAKQVLTDVVNQHSGTSAAKLAESELQSLKSSS